MKNLFFASTIFAAAIMALTKEANAQFVVSGSAGIVSENSANNGDKESASFSFEVVPSVGYVMGSWEVGVGFGYNRSKTSVWTDGRKNTESESAYAIEPYLHYDILQAGRLIFGAEAISAFGFADSERSVKLELLPVLTIEINDRWDFDIIANVLGVNYSHTKNKDTDHTTSNFELMANNGHLLNMGFTYKF